MLRLTKIIKTTTQDYRYHTIEIELQVPLFITLESVDSIHGSTEVSGQSVITTRTGIQHVVVGSPVEIEQAYRKYNEEMIMTSNFGYDPDRGPKTEFEEEMRQKGIE